MSKYSSKSRRQANSEEKQLELPLKRITLGVYPRGVAEALLGISKMRSSESYMVPLAPGVFLFAECIDSTRKEKKTGKRTSRGYGWLLSIGTGGDGEDPTAGLPSVNPRSPHPLTHIAA